MFTVPNPSWKMFSKHTEELFCFIVDNTKIAHQCNAYYVIGSYVKNTLS